MLTQCCPLLNLPWPPFRQIIDAVALLDDPFTLSMVIPLQRVCKRFEHELTNSIFAQKRVRIREGNSDIMFIFPLMRRKILERAAAGTLDESGLKSAILTVGQSLQTEHHVLQELDQHAIFNIFFNAAVDYRDPSEAVSEIFKPGTPVLGPVEIRVHTMVIAAYLGETKVVQSLLSRNVDPNDPSVYFGFALSAAARRGHPDTVKLLLDNGADSHTGGRFHWRTAIVAAAEAGHEEIIKILIESKHKHPTSGDAIDYALKKSVAGKHIASAFLLLNWATFENPGFLHQDILEASSRNGCLPLVKAMVERGADANRCSREPPRLWPVELAARGGHDDVVSYLIANGAKLDGVSQLGDDAITAAAAHGHLSTLKILLQHGADINSRLGQGGTTPLYHAACYNHVDTVRFLLEKGAMLDVMRDDRMTFVGYMALQDAIQRGRKEVVQALAEGGMNVKSVAPYCTKNDPSLIILAKMWGHDDVVMLLLELGAEDVDPLETRWADDFRNGVYPKSLWTLKKRMS